jgi:Uma2 family endonuclease
MTQKTRPDIAEWLRSLGNVPLDRIVMDPLPGTADERDLLRLVERDKRLVELIDGTLVEKPVGFYESLIAGWLITALNNFVLPRKLGFVSGEAGMMRMVSGRIRLPDVAFIANEDLPGGSIPTEPVPTLRPTIAAEVLSETNTVAEIRLKLSEYFESGSRLAWVIDPPTRTVAIYTAFTAQPIHVLADGDVLDGGEVLPGFSIRVSDLFRPAPSKE